MTEEEIRSALLELGELWNKAYSNSDSMFYEAQAGWPHRKELEEKIKSLQEKLPGFHVDIYQSKFISARFGIVPKADWEIEKDRERLKKSQEEG